MNANQTMLEQLDLRDIQIPDMPSGWPPAPGWWLLAALGLAGLVLLGRHFWSQLRRIRRRRRIFAELNRLRTEHCGPTLIRGISTLLKRVALSRFQRLDVAALTGPEWLAFLDRTGGAGGFQSGAGRVLAEGPYAPSPNCDANALLALAQDWLRKNT
ncbi:MAG TPA: DUF4381 domain-containing protein [Chromatiaceae bacterium]|jgi:hypothetical protein|nr:MAG: hypothetical protein N838_04585 [Thiohalocapsa sp. PB-PSB1]QQO57436.1 MAG: DUF4381 domain-containing protein [Thiohalocapsa sp. PB-PSB1]HBG96186.1 DUF4381 domain-containing protein [Chromatiaceae bacterium]